MQLPTITSADETGLVMDIAAVGHYAIDQGNYAYVRTTDGTTWRLPEALTDWALHSIGANLVANEAGATSMYPCPVEFGILDNRPYADYIITTADFGASPTP